jgi:uncharacterized membrane protein YfcA
MARQTIAGGARMTGFEQLLLFVISLVANVFSAFAGGGAGLLQFPALIFLGLPFGVALATHKVASVALGVGATLRHVREKSVEWRFSMFILATGLPGVVLGATVILAVPGHIAQLLLGILTIGLGVYSFLNKQLGQDYMPRNRNARGLALGGTGLFFVGLLNGSLTSGTGLFCTLWLVRWFGLDYRRAVAYTLVLVGMFWNGARVAGRGQMVMAAGIDCGFAGGGVPRRTLGDRQGQPLDKARLRDCDCIGGIETGPLRRALALHLRNITSMQKMP